nr:sigma factor [Paenibacillus artemisiicola]
MIQANKVVMYQVAKTILKRDADCEDAIQEAIIRSFEKIQTLREATYFKTWLLRILINECNQNFPKMTLDRTIKVLTDVIEENRTELFHVITVNPEITMACQ